MRMFGIALVVLYMFSLLLVSLALGIWGWAIILLDWSLPSLKLIAILALWGYSGALGFQVSNLGKKVEGWLD